MRRGVRRFDVDDGARLLSMAEAVRELALSRT